MDDHNTSPWRLAILVFVILGILMGGIKAAISKERCFTTSKFVDVMKADAKKHNRIIKIFLWESKDANFVTYTFNKAHPDKVMLSFFNTNQCIMPLHGKYTRVVEIIDTIKTNLKTAHLVYERVPKAKTKES